MLYSQKLRHLAGWLEDHPEINDKLVGYWEYPSIWIGVGDDTEEFGRLCRAMGEFEKERNIYSDSLGATHLAETDDTRIFRATVSVSGVCEKVAKLDEDGNVVTKKVTKTVPVATEEVEVEEVEYEWHCPESWLSL